MGTLLSPAKVVLLAVHLAAHADIASLASLASQHDAVLRRHVLLRILLTYLPETVRPVEYLGLLQQLAAGHVHAPPDAELDDAPVRDLSDDDAARRVRRLRLLSLACPDAPPATEDDPVALFVFHRAYKVDQEAGLLAQLPELLVPFLDHTPAVRTWMASTLLPLLRRNAQYYAEPAAAYSLLDFQRLPDVAAVDYLLSRTGLDERDHGNLGRDLRGLVAPWLYEDARWKPTDDLDPALDLGPPGSSSYSPGWEHALEWLVLQASRSWKVAVGVIEQWGGPRDADCGEAVGLAHADHRQRYLDRSYARAALAAAYQIPAATTDALSGAYDISTRVRSLLGEEPPAPLAEAASHLFDLPTLDALSGVKTASYMRSNLLQPDNPLTSPGTDAVDFLLALVLSAFITTRLGVPWTVRMAGELAILQDQREQKAELSKLVRTLFGHASRGDDDFWSRVRREILWLHSWGGQSRKAIEACVGGVFGAVSREFIETELLKALLLNSRYSLASTLYETGQKKPLADAVVQDTLCHCALNAFDNATNPNRTRGGLKKCDEIIGSFPVTLDKSHPARRRVEALLNATHALSAYRLVLKQGEPFSPVVLRVHSDPISIIEKVLEQNPGAYTRFQEFLETGINMIRAGLPTGSRSARSAASLARDQDIDFLVAEKRIVSMCIRAALAEDDFETAYSYVVSRLDPSGPNREDERAGFSQDEWSWSAALKAGQYIRTERSLQPTHLGTSSGNPEIRHLEQRIECLATALRVAPPSQLQEILKTFRRCEEQLDSAVKDEAAKEAAWDAEGDTAELPGAFDSPNPGKAYPPRNITASAVARQAEEAPMSLFDLSRATASVAQKNFTALSSLRGIAQGSSIHREPPSSDDPPEPRARKRDQLREAATGTLVSGVGWLIGANVNKGETDAK